MKTAEDWTKPDGICDCIPTVDFIRAIQADALESAALHLEEQSAYYDHATGTLLCMAREIRALIPQGASVTP